MMDVTANQFDTDVVEASYQVPILVDFWASWCAPCRVLAPVLESLEAKMKGRFRLVKVNTEHEPALAQRYRISGIPAVKLFVDGKIKGEFAGAMPEPVVERFLDEHIPSDADKWVAKGEDLLAQGRTDDARAAFEQALEIETRHERARVDLASTLVIHDTKRAVALVSEISEGSPVGDEANAVRTLGRLLMVDLEHPDDSVLDRSSKGWPAYCEGIGAFRQGRYSDAAVAWIDALKRDRKLDDDGARKACIALFQWLGDHHEVTVSMRRAFSSALF